MRTKRTQQQLFDAKIDPPLATAADALIENIDAEKHAKETLKNAEKIFVDEMRKAGKKVIFHAGKEISVALTEAKEKIRVRERAKKRARATRRKR